MPSAICANCRRSPMWIVLNCTWILYDGSTGSAVPAAQGQAARWWRQWQRDDMCDGACLIICRSASAFFGCSLSATRLIAGFRSSSRLFSGLRIICFTGEPCRMSAKAESGGRALACLHKLMRPQDFFQRWAGPSSGALRHRLPIPGMGEAPTLYLPQQAS